MTGLYRGVRTEDGRLLSTDAAFSFDGDRFVLVELEDGPDLTQRDSRFPPPMPTEAAHGRIP